MGVYDSTEPDLWSPYEGRGTRRVTDCDEPDVMQLVFCKGLCLGKEVNRKIGKAATW